MALEATHIRFAVDLKDKYQVRDMEDYVVGAVYPDSRRKTGIDRELTHPKNFREWDLGQLDDFKKGWFTHLLCDSLQSRCIKRLFPGIFIEEITAGSPGWISLTAIKALADIDDFTKFNIKAFLPNTHKIHTHNNEDELLLSQFYGSINQAYGEAKPFSLEEYGMKLTRLGMPEEYAIKITTRTKHYAQDKKALTKILQIYPEILAEALQNSSVP
jgi:hypothetical protein